jgi:hypothetical protein
MTHFEPLPDLGEGVYQMHTLFPTPSVHALESAGNIGGFNLTEGIRRVVGLQTFYKECHALGDLAIAVAEDGRITSLPEVPAQVDEPLSKVNALVSSNLKNELQPMTKPDREDDLVDFWRAGVAAFSNVNERHALGAKFCIIKCGLKGMKEVMLGDMFESDFEAAKAQHDKPKTLKQTLRKYLFDW